MKQCKLILAILLFYGSTLNAQQRFVLYEEFTGSWCPPSRPTDSALWALLNSGTNPDHIQFITYVVNWGPGDILYNSAPTEYGNRGYYYGIPFISYGRIDGEEHDTNTASTGIPWHHTQDVLDAEIAVASPFNITASFTYNTAGDSIVIKAHVECVSTYAPVPAAVKLRTAFVSTLDYFTPPGSNGMTHFENMVRKMYPIPQGTPISDIWAIGDTADFIIKGKKFNEKADSILHPHAYTPGYVVVWIQNDSGKVIAQAAKALPWVLTSTSLENIAQRASQDLVIFPNPAKTQATLLFDIDNSDVSSLVVSDIFGHIVYSKNEYTLAGKHNLKVPIAGLANGMYYATIHTTSKKYQGSFLVVN